MFLNCSCSHFIAIIPFCLFFCEFVEFAERGCNDEEVVFMVVSRHSRDGCYVHKISIIITINIKKKSSKSDANNNTAMTFVLHAKHGELHALDREPLQEQNQSKFLHCILNSAEQWFHYRDMGAETCRLHLT